jgi:hypothetical protein
VKNGLVDIPHWNVGRSPPSFLLPLPGMETSKLWYPGRPMPSPLESAWQATGTLIFTATVLLVGGVGNLGERPHGLRSGDHGGLPWSTANYSRCTPQKTSTPAGIAEPHDDTVVLTHTHLPDGGHRQRRSGARRPRS